MRPEPYDVKMDNKATEETALANHPNDKTRPPRVVLRVTTDDVERVAKELQYPLTPKIVADVELVLQDYKDKLIGYCLDYVTKF